MCVLPILLGLKFPASVGGRLPNNVKWPLKCLTVNAVKSSLICHTLIFITKKKNHPDSGEHNLFMFNANVMNTAWYILHIEISRVWH